MSQDVITGTLCNMFDEVVDVTLFVRIAEISGPKQDPQSHTIENMGLDTTHVKMIRISWR